MNRHFQSGLLLAVGLTAVLALSGCSMLSRYLPGGETPAASSSSQSSQSSQPAASPADRSEEHVIEGTINIIDKDLEYLVLVTDDGYARLGFADAGLDLSSLAPGDSITVTYTGPLEPDSEDVTAQLVSVTKDT